ncbi:ABC transporter substrate-binding protein [Hydrogenophaga sp. NFH-34]|uniref:ABC transporter substrate-binding protein n=1 Tax=Hydrogenophaga sp. NFH-34 TaxID=2744446 RepID=UPI001F1CF3F0|nr:ABC transporter substrate-binding protein [Hydrogenophaga sp. NFH-34]
MSPLIASVFRTGARAGLAALLGAGVLAGAQAQTLVPGSLKVALEATYPPFESYDGDKIVGFDPDLTALLTREMKLKHTLVDTKFINLVPGLAANQHDAVVSGLYVTNERLAQADAVPYANTGALILVAKDSKVQPKTEKDLCGLKVGLQAGTAWVKQLQTLSSDYCKSAGKAAVNVMEFPTAPEVSQAVMARNVDAQMEIAGAAKMIVERTKGRMAISSPDLVYPQTLGLYVKKGNTALLKAFQDAMVAIKKTGEYDALIKKYDLSPVK